MSLLSEWLLREPVTLDSASILDRDRGLVDYGRVFLLCHVI